MSTKDIYKHVENFYGSVEKTQSGQHEQSVAKAFGYTEEELAYLPEGSNLGLSCGNPLALAKLKEGETVIDIGSGAGFDVFGAARKIGLSGQAIGVDMSEIMINKANKNQIKAGTHNVKFIQSVITSIPLPDTIADCIISNCVVNLVPAVEKQKVFDEMFRLLKPGGRLAISDTLARRDIPEQMRLNMALYVGCISGASQVDEYRTHLKNAGFADILIIDANIDLNVFKSAATDGSPRSCCPDRDDGVCVSPGSPGTKTDEAAGCTRESNTSCWQPASSFGDAATRIAAPMDNLDLNEWAGSFKVYAIKPTTAPNDSAAS